MKCSLVVFVIIDKEFNSFTEAVLEGYRIEILRFNKLDHEIENRRTLNVSKVRGKVAVDLKIFLLKFEKFICSII